MLTPADADLVRRDPALPGLATLLDPEALADLTGAERASARITYVRYKPGTSCLVGCRLETNGGAADAVARAYPRGAREKLVKSDRPGRVVLAEEGVAVSFFPDDDRLTVLPRLADPAGRAEFLRKLLPERPDLWGAAVGTLRYKPARRFVARLAVDGVPKAALKAYTAAGYEAAQANAKAVRSCSVFRCPTRLGRSTRHRVVALEWLPGRLLTEVLSDPAFDPGAVEAVGAALAALHAQKSGRLPPRTRAEEAASLPPLAGWVGHVCPDLADRARRLAGRLAELVERLPVAARPVHGDFYAKQVLLDAGRVGLLDFDEAFRGDPTVDLGLFLAHLWRDVLRGTVPLDRVGPVRAALLAGYRSPPPHVGLYAAVGLLRLAPHPFRSREPDWPGRTADLLDRAERELREFVGSRAPVAVGGARTAVVIEDPFGAAGDPKMPFLGEALVPAEAEARLGEACGPLLRDRRLRAIRVTRYKPGRRCLIEYDFEADRRGEGVFTLVGKARAKGADRESFALMRTLWNGGFDADSPDGVSVPEPVGLVPAFGMWLQRKVAGVASTHLFTGAGGAQARWVAEAVHKLHRAGAPAHRHHTPADELAVLGERLGELARERPAWASRLERLLAACRRVAATTPASARCGVHRDFYPDHVLVDGPRLVLLDFDLYCEADPALDAGNFLGHLTEQSVRTTGRPDALAEAERAFEDAYVELAGESCRPAIRTYAVLTLVRHVAISARFPERRPFTERLLELCEERLGLDPPATR